MQSSSNPRVKFCFYSISTRIESDRKQITVERHLKQLSLCSSSHSTDKFVTIRSSSSRENMLARLRTTVVFFFKRMFYFSENPHFPSTRLNNKKLFSSSFTSSSSSSFFLVYSFGCSLSPSNPFFSFFFK